MPRIVTRLVAAALAVLGVTASAQPAQPAWPTKPVRIIMPYAAGGPADAILRAMAPQLGKAWGQPLVMDYRPGANEAVGVAELTKSANDGHTLLIATDAAYALNPLLHSKLHYDAQKDLVPVSLLMNAPLMLLARPDFPGSTVAEVIDYGKRNPDKLSYASTGQGASNHLAMEWFKRTFGIEAVHVPYNSLPIALQDLATSRTDLTMVVTGGARAFLEGGRIKPIAVSGSHRQPLAPNVPTFEQAGAGKYQAGVFFGLAAPARTPEAVRLRIAADMAKILQTPQFQKDYLSIYGFDAVGSTPAEFAEFLVHARVDAKARMAAAGVKPD